jgi:amino acid transporter
MDKKQSILEIVNFIGSIASITGISLLWLKGTENINPVDILATTVVVSISFGFLFLGIGIILYIYRRWVKNLDWVWKIVFFCLFLPITGVSIWLIAVSTILGMEKAIKYVTFR